MSNTIEITTTRTVTVPENAREIEGVWFVPREKDASKKYAKVERILAQVMDATDDEGKHVPVEFAVIAERAGEKYPQDVQAALQALEVLGMVEAFKAIDPNTGNPRASVFYALVDPPSDEDEQDESSDEDAPERETDEAPENEASSDEERDEESSDES